LDSPGLIADREPPPNVLRLFQLAGEMGELGYASTVAKGCRVARSVIFVHLAISVFRAWQILAVYAGAVAGLAGGDSGRRYHRPGARRSGNHRPCHRVAGGPGIPG